MLLGLPTYSTCTLLTVCDYTDSPLFTRISDLHCITCTNSPRLSKHPSDTLLAPTLSHLTKTADTLASHISVPDLYLQNYLATLHQPVRTFVSCIYPTLPDTLYTSNNSLACLTLRALIYPPKPSCTPTFASRRFSIKPCIPITFRLNLFDFDVFLLILYKPIARLAYLTDCHLRTTTACVLLTCATQASLYNDALCLNNALTLATLRQLYTPVATRSAYFRNRNANVSCSTNFL